MEFDAGIDCDAISGLAIRATRDAWPERLDAAAAARPLWEVDLPALARPGDVDELRQERAPP